MEPQPPIVKKKETRGRKPKPKEEKKEEAVKAKEGKKAQQPSVDDKYTQWKSLVPVLYDWLANHNLVWPSLSCRYPYKHMQYLSQSFLGF
jgi:histone-binding protein RBBP4